MARLRSLFAGLAAAAMAGTLLSGPAAASSATATPQPLPNPSGAGASGPASGNATFGIQPATEDERRESARVRHGDEGCW